MRRGDLKIGNETLVYTTQEQALELIISMWSNGLTILLLGNCAGEMFK